MERRRASRVSMGSVSAQVTSLGRWTHAVVSDLSLGGAQLVGDDLPAAGTWARLQISLDGFALRLETMAVWRHELDRRGGLAFDPLSQVQRRAIADALLRADHSDGSTAGTIVTLINGSPRFGEVARAITGRGFAVAVADTPADAIRVVRDAEPPVRAAIVARDPGSESSERLLEALASTHPGVLRVLLLDGVDKASSQDALAADRVLLWPWQDVDLDAVFQLIQQPIEASSAHAARILQTS